MGEEGSKLIFQWTAEGKITDDDEEVTSEKELKTYWQLFKDYAKPRSNSLIVVVELKKIIPWFHDHYNNLLLKLHF